MSDVDSGGGTASASFPFRMLFSSKDAGTIIGKGGVNIKSIREQSGCTVSIADQQAGQLERLTTITGVASGISQAVALALTVLDEDPQAQTSSMGSLAERTVRCVLSNNAAGRVIGKAGASVKQIREMSGASIKMDQPTEAQQDRVVSIGGSKDAVVSALQQILEIVAMMPPDSRDSGGGGAPKRQAVGAPAAYGYGAPPAGYAVPPPGYAAHYAMYGGQPHQQQPPYAPYGQQQQPGLAPPPAYHHAAYPPAALAGGGATADLPPCELVQLVKEEGAGRLIGRCAAAVDPRC